MTITSNDALIVVDVQNDFAPGGKLPVSDGKEVIPIVNQLEPLFEHLVFTRDWHPADHCSFSDEPEFIDGSWPRHCVENTPGAEFAEGLHVPLDAVVVDKATEADAEAYSAFDNTNLAAELRQRDIQRVFICGLATDFCVKATALEAKTSGFETHVLLDACRGIDGPRGSVADALDAMREAGITLCQSQALLT